jgi:hypothetical protein
MAFFVGSPGWLYLEIKPMPDDLETKIRENAAGPAKVSGDAGSDEQHSLADQIAADRYLSSKEAATKPLRGLRLNKFVPSGTA